MGFESYGNREQVSLGNGPNVFIATEHFGQKFNPNDSTAYPSDSVVARIYNGLKNSVGQVETDNNSTGTAYVVSTDGYMVTDHHVVTSSDGSPNMTVYINGRAHNATWVDARDAQQVLNDYGAPDDLALLKVTPIGNETFQPVKFANPQSVKATDPRVALGFPEGLGKLFVSPTPDLDGLLQASTASTASNISLAGWTKPDKVGPKENINRNVDHTDMEVQHGNSGSLVGSINDKGEVVVVGTVGMSNVTPAALPIPLLDASGAIQHDSTGNVIFQRTADGKLITKPNPVGEIGTEAISTPVEPTLAFLRRAGINADVASPTYAANDVVPPTRQSLPKDVAELEYRFAADSLFEFS
jgi:hypothetical protein